MSGERETGSSGHAGRQRTGTSLLERRVRGEKPVPRAPVAKKAVEEKRKPRVWLIVALSAVGLLLVGGIILGVVLSRDRGGSKPVREGPTPAATAAPTNPIGTGGTWQFLPLQEHPEKGWTAYHALLGDVNGDGRADLVWNQTAETNRVYVGLANADGTFAFLPAQERTERRWGGFRTLLGDVNGDGRADLVWNETAEVNRVYVGLGNADGTLVFLPAQDRAERRWGGFRTFIGDVNGDGRADLIWNELAETNRLYVGLGNADGTFSFLPAQDHPEKGWRGFAALVADLNGDGRSDIAWEAAGKPRRIAVALANADGTWAFEPLREASLPLPNDVQALAGDVNGDGRADLIWNARGETNRVVVGLANADGTLALLPPQEHAARGWSGFGLLAGDVNGDGRADLVWNELGKTNRTYFGLANADGTFSFPPLQERPEEGWGGSVLLLGDVDGNGRADLVWNQVWESNRILVGLSEP